MSVVLYRNGKLKLFTPYEFKDYLDRGWCFSKLESLQNGLRKEREIEVEAEAKAEEVEEVKVVVEVEEPEVKRKKKYFICAGCQKKRVRYPEDILHEDDKKYCSEDCKAIFKE